MHDTDGISSHRRVKNSTLLRSRVEFRIKSFCFFTVYLTGGTSHRSAVLYFVQAAGIRSVSPIFVGNGFIRSALVTDIPGYIEWKNDGSFRFAEPWWIMNLSERINAFSTDKYRSSAKE